MFVTASVLPALVDAAIAGVLSVSSGVGLEAPFLRSTCNAQRADVLGRAPKLPDGSDATAPRASGTLKAHYAPRTPLALLPFDALEPLLAAAQTDGERVALVARASRAGQWAQADGVHFVAAPEDPSAYARELYGMLRALDRAQVARILVEKLPETVEWIAVNDRLGRAAAAFEAAE